MGTGKEAATLKGHKEAVNWVLYSPDGKSLVSGGWDKTIRLWDLGAGKERRARRAHWHGARCRFQPGWNNSRFRWSGWRRSAVARRHGKEQAVLRGHTDLVRWLAFAPDGRTVASASKDGSIRLWDVTTGKVRAEAITGAGPVLTLASLPDGKTLATGGIDNKVSLWEVARLPGPKANE